MGGELTIGDIFRNAARAVPQRPAAVLGDAVLTFADIDRGANRLAHALRRRGVRHGDRVVVWSGTDLEVVPLFAALAKTGAVYAPVGANLRPDEAAAVAGAARPTLVVVDAAHAEAGQELAASVDAPLAVLRAPNAGPGAGPGPGTRSRGGRPPTTLARDAGAADHTHDDDGDVRDEGLTEDDPHVVFFTSGSTGRPKGAVLSHRTNALRSHPGALLEPRGPMVCPYPLFHMGAWTIALQQWQGRAAVVFLGAADAGAITTAAARHGATRLNAIPAVWGRILATADGDGRVPGLSTLRFADTGTSATPVELLEAMARAAPGAQVRVFYGSTEAGSVAALDHADIARKPGSCGLPGPGVEVRLADDGELQVRGPLLFDGYFGDDDATASAFTDGWYRTGDLAELDDEGYLTITGRVHDVIRTGGEAVSPAEVEAVLAGHAAVEDVAVVGLPDPAWGEIVCAVVVVASGAHPPTLDDLQAHCAGHLAPFKLPRRLETLPVLPRTDSTHQVMRRLLAERFG